MVNQSIKKYTLPNGLTYLLYPKSYSSTVIIHLTIDAGSSHDPDNKLGLAHLLEHLVVSGSNNYKTPFSLGQIILNHGGTYNVFTEREYVKFETITTTTHIEDGFKYLAEIIFNPLLTKNTLVREKTIINQEIKINNSDPNQQFWQKTLSVRWPKNWKSNSITGTLTSIDKITLSDVRHFHNKHYQPKNIVAIISGNFNQKTITNLINQYLNR